METKNVAISPEEKKDEEGKSTQKVYEMLPLMMAYFIKFSQSEDVFKNHPELKKFEVVQLFYGSDCIEKCLIQLKKDCYEIKTALRISQDLEWDERLQKHFDEENECGICKR